MKKLYPTLLVTLAIILATFTAGAQAPDIEIGAGTEDAGLPINPFYGYSYSQTIFLQEELNTDGQRIHKIAFYYEGGSRWSDQIRVFMAHTSQDELTDYITEGLTLVYEGEYPVMNQEGWMEIPLTVPFEYNNTDNLLIAMTEDKPGFRLNSVFHSTQVTGNMSIIATKDGSPAYDVNNPPTNGQLQPYRPNIRMWFESIPAGPAVSIIPSQLYFLYIRENEEKMLNVTVINTGTEDLVISGLEAGGMPFVTNFSGTIAPGETQLVDIRFVPEEVGDYPGHLSLQTNSSVDPVYIYTEAFSVPELAIVETFVETTFPPEDWYVDPNSWTRRGFGGFEGGGNAYLNTGTDFGYLVTPKLNIQEGNKLIFYAAQQLDGELTVSHSYDMEEWTELENIILTRQFQRYIIDLDGFEGAGYIGFSGIPRIYLDYVVAPEVHLELPPNTVTNPLPADGFENAFITQNLYWNASNTAQGYKVYLGTDNPPTNVVNGEDIGNIRRYKTPVLDYDTGYFWQIVPYNEYGDAEDCPVWSFTTIAYSPVVEFPFEEGFENDNGAVPPAGWINEDGYWDSTGNAHTGQYAARASFYHPVDANLITPPVQLPESENMSLIFYWKNGNVYGKNDKITGHDTLYVEITNDMGQNWIEQGIFSAPDVMEEYLPVQVDLAAYSGEEIYIRFRHSTDGEPVTAMPVGIDDIKISSSLEEPVIWVNQDYWTAGNIANNTYVFSEGFRLRNMGAGTLTITDAYFDGDSYTTTFDAGEVSLEFGEEYHFSFGFEPFETGSYLVNFIIESNGGDLEIELFGVSEHVDPFTFDGFEDGEVPPWGWMAHDEDGDEINWMRAWNHAIPAYNGTFSAVSFSYVAGLGELDPDNWFITPKIHVQEDQEFTYFIACGSEEYHADHYTLYVSTTTNRLDQFTHVLHEETLKPEDVEWSQRVFDLNEWAGQEIYIAFRHHDSEGQDYIKLDDIEVRDKLVVQPPYADPPAGAVPAGTMVSLFTDTQDAQIFYTLDGETPDNESILYEEPVEIVEPLTIKAVAFLDEVYSEVSTFEYTIDDTSVEELSADGFSIYPNPASDKIYLLKDHERPVTVSVINIVGSVVANYHMVSREIIIDAGDLGPGIYMIRLDDGKETRFRKLIVQ
jgi:hypothetical protein